MNLRFAFVFAVTISTAFAQSLPSSTAPPCDQSPADAVRYTVLLAGNRAGLETSWTAADKSLHTCFEFTDRGRGPRYRTEYRTGQGGIPIFEHTTGNDYLKAAVDERFALENGRASWSNKAENNGKPVAAPTFYIAMNGPAQESALLVRALLAAPKQTLPLLPAGQATAERIRGLDVAANGQKKHLTQYAISGLAFSPSYVWLDENNNFFAQVSGWLSVIRAGWEDSAAALDESQDATLAARDLELARRLGRKPAGPLVIEHAQLFDSESASVARKITVVISGNRIQQVAPDSEAKIPANAQFIDATGKTLLPGLWDMHVHLSEGDGLLDIANGVTTVRDLANDTDKLLAMRKSFDEGTAVGPRIIMAGIIDGKGPFAGPTKVLVDTPEGARAAVDNYKKLGYVQIKIYSSVKPQLVPVIVAEAHKLGLRVSGHVPAFMTAEQAVLEGYDEIQHINFLFLNFFFDKVQDTRTPARFTVIAQNAPDLDLHSERVRKFIQLLKDHHTKLDPTLDAFEMMFVSRPGQVSPSYAAVADRMPVQVRREFMSGGLPVPDGMDQRYRDAFQAMLNFVGELYRAGIPIEAGTDQMAGFSLHRELELYVRAGIPAPKVLQLATLGAARIMSRDRDLGSIAPGKLADVIVVDGDPAASISDIRRVTTVVKDGVVYEVPELDRALGIAPLATTTGN
jgi:hypothetical protein